MNGLIAAIQFMTVLPVGRPARFRPAEMVPFFPVVGLVLGALLSAVDQLAIRLWSVPAASLVDILFLAVVTGAFHLDGLGDTADGLFSHRGRTEALRIMKDSRMGAMGLMAVFFGLTVKWAGLAGIDPAQRGLLLVLIPAYARAGMVVAMGQLPYCRPGGGTGRPFFDRPIGWTALWGLGIPVALSVFLGWNGLVLNLFFLGTTVAVVGFYRKAMGGVTGDMLGAMTETLEALLFLFMSVGVLQ